MKNERIGSEVIEHWYTFVDGCQFSADEFYESVEAELAKREIPRLKSARVQFRQGSILSDKRVYLRLARERFAFDVCAAPFGTGYFFSLRFVMKRRGGWGQLFAWLGLFATSVMLFSLLTHTNGLAFVGVAIAVGVVIWLVGLARKEMARDISQPSTAEDGELPDFDTFLLNIPGLGEWYERSRKDTYYRYDTRLLYHLVVSSVVKKLAEDFAAAKGVQLVREFTYSPVFGDLYKTKGDPSVATTESASA